MTLSLHEPDPLSPVNPLTRFIRALRGAGMQVSSSEAIDAARAVALVGYQDRDALKTALASVVSKCEEDDRLYEGVFETFFTPVQAQQLAQQQAQSQDSESESSSQDGKSSSAQPGNASQNEMQADPLQMQGQGNPSMSEGAQAGSPSGQGAGDPDSFMSLARSNDPNRLAVALARAASAVGADEIRFASQSAYFVRKMLEKLGVEELERALEAAIEERTAEGRARAQALIAARAALQKAARAHVEKRFEMFGRAATETFMDEVVTQREIAELSQRDMERMKVVIARMAKRLAVRHSRPRKVRNRGQLDVRRTLRANAGVGGVPFDLVWKMKKRDKPKIVAICDVSGSVAQYVRFLLLFLHALSEKVADLEAFAFSARLMDVGSILQRMDFEPAMNRIVHEAGSGSTDYGQALVDLNKTHWDVIDRRTTVIMLGDGRSNMSDPRLDLFSELADRSRRMVWLCPEPPRRWGTGDSVILQYQAFCTQLSYCATAADLERVIDEVLEAYA
jgi:uncharacterized protein with von Willebrand factor type A (vWA) domain